MKSGHSVFNGAFGWSDWVWWGVLGCLALFILLLLVCCCVCIQRAKRKGHEEALAAVHASQRYTQERAEQQRQQPLSQYQPPSNTYPKQMTAVPLAPPPNRRNIGPQVSANSSNTVKSHRQAPGQAPHQDQNYRPPPKWYNQSQREANCDYPESMRFDDPFPTGGSPNKVVTSPSASESVNRNNGVRFQPSQSLQKSNPAPNGMVRAPSSPNLHRGSTLQARIEALRSADASDSVHSRISVESTNLRSSLARTGPIRLQMSDASNSFRRSGLALGSVLSPNELPSLPSPSISIDSYSSYDPDALESANSTNDSNRSSYSIGQFDDADNSQRQTKDTATVSQRDNVVYTSHHSVEF